MGTCPTLVLRQRSDWSLLQPCLCPLREHCAGGEREAGGCDIPWEQVPGSLWMGRGWGIASSSENPGCEMLQLSPSSAPSAGVPARGGTWAQGAAGTQSSLTGRCSSGVCVT